MFASVLSLLINYFIVFSILFTSVGRNLPTEETRTDFDQCKNVIFMIGDGMGFNSLNKTKAEKEIDTLAMNTFPLQGESQTRSADNIVTDSAAGGTALACGIRTNNGFVGVYGYDGYDLVNHPMNLCELAKSQGKTAGIVTTDSTSGATPASFSAHAHNRGDEEDITFQQLRCDLDLIWGAATASFSEETASEYGFTSIYNKADMDALTEGSRSFGQFTDSVWHEVANEGMPTMTEMVVKAIDLLDDDEDGFFLMVEGAHIDKNNHSNNAEGMEDALVAFDQAVQAALDYAAADGDTLVLVTADHETGGITLKDGEYVYTKDGHTGVNVPLLVYGCDNFIENGQAVKNKEVARRVACVMGYNSFPHRIHEPVEHGGRNDDSPFYPVR
ncbi:MAG: alkaline phosphatase [Clostridia bacterium]|nr:alkaline phosphatase [Clostridia bacterium]